MSAGKLQWARKVGDTAIQARRASPSLLLEMARDANKMRESNREQNILFQGISMFPNDHSLWRHLVQNEIEKKDYAQAFKVVQMFEERNPSLSNHPHFRSEVYVCLVGLGRGDEADLWFRKHLLHSKILKQNPPLYLAHAMITRELQKGQWITAEKKAKGWIAEGIRSSQLYQDWMTALGATNNPIGEAHAAREAIAFGFESQWIRDQLAFLEQKGY